MENSTCKAEHLQDTSGIFQAEKCAPSVVFLDELDGLVPARSGKCGGADQIFSR